LTKWYEKNLGLRGGYSRRIRSNLPSSIANSQYIVSDDVGLRVVALSGKRLAKPQFINEPHYSHHYGSKRIKTPTQKQLIKREYQKERKRFLRG